MNESYWSSVLNRRLSRRRALAATGASAGAAAFLAACGGGGGGGGGGSEGLVTKPEDTSRSARRGGVFKWSQNQEPLHFDGGVQGQAQLNVFNGLAYGSLVQNKPGHLEPTSNTEVVPDLAESWEVSGDKLSVTFKLRQGVKWANIPPVSGRLFDSEDVVQNWKRYEAKGGNKAANANAANPSAPIVSVEAPDKQTVVYKLNRPTSFFLQRLATMVTGEAGTQLPREADNTFDPREKQIGTGGFIQDRYTPSVGFVYRRNPDYWNEKEPYIETLEIPIVNQYPTGLTQLKAGGVYTYAVQQPDILTTKRETPALNLFQNVISGSNPAAMIGFGWLPLPDGQKSPFLDIRVRQALSLSFDRDAFIDTFSNVSQFESEGLPMQTFYYSAMAYVPDVWLDPRDEKAFGPNSFYYTYNPSEAKKLLSAAYPNGMPEVEAKHITGNQFGVDHQDQVQVLHNYAQEVGFKFRVKPIDYNLEYLPQIVTQQGKFQGLAWRFGATTSSDPLDYYVWRFWSKSGPTSGSLGFGGPDGSLGDQSGDPQVDDLIEKAYAELDVKKRNELIQDMQRILGKQQYGVTRPGVASNFLVAWPVVGNYQVFQGDSRAGLSAVYTWWVDDQKPPIKQA